IGPTPRVLWPPTAVCAGFRTRDRLEPPSGTAVIPRLLTESVAAGPGRDNEGRDVIEWSLSQRGCRAVTDSRATIAYVSGAGQAAELAAAARIPESAVDKILIDEGEDTLDQLQDAVYAGSVGRVLIPSLAILGPDLMAQEAILASWVERSIAVFCRDERDLGG